MTAFGPFGRWTMVIAALALALAAEGRPDAADRSLRDVLEAIEARLDAGQRAECVGERMDAFEAKLGRIEVKLEEHLGKIRQGEIAKEVLKEPSASELGKKMDSTAEKMFARLGIFEAKSGIQVAGVGVKVQRLERHLGRSLDDALDKILKIEEKNAQMMESLWRMHVGADAEEGPAKLRAEVQLDDRWAADGRTEAAACPTLLLHNLSEAMLVNEKKVAELDGDVEIYTRKVLNAYRELSVEHKGMESGLGQVAAQGNHTHELVRDGFRRLVQHMKPVTAFDDILRSLHKKVSELENTIDASFASLLVAQNMFIGLLQRLVTKMDEKSSVSLHSSSDILWTALDSHRKDMGRALHDLVWTVIKVGNETMDEMARTFGQLQQQRECPCSAGVSDNGTKDGAMAQGLDQRVSPTHLPEDGEEEEKRDDKKSVEVQGPK